MKANVPKSVAGQWTSLGKVYPRHRMVGQWHNLYKGTAGYCTDDAPNGWGNFGCKRCQAIVDMEKRGIKIWPRKEVKS